MSRCVSTRKKISTTNLPLLNPYSSVANKACNPWMQINFMVQDKIIKVKEYVAGTKCAQHPILTTQDE